MYEYRVFYHGGGWWYIHWRFAASDRDPEPRPWQVVAKVLGEKRAQIVRDALSAEANERV